MTISAIQQSLHVGKDKTNDFGGYNYRTAEGILAAVKPHLPEGHWINLTDDVIDVAGSIFVKSTATLMDGANAIASSVSAAMHPLTKKGMDPSQITGSASSYARKYALSGLLAIDDSSGDPDAAKTHYEPAPLDEVIAKSIANAPDAETLKGLWDGNPSYHDDAQFRRAINARKSELTQKEAS